MSLLSPRDISLYSGLATDKIVAVYEGSFNTATAPLIGGFIPYVAIPHSFTRPVFTKVMASKDAVTWSDENSFNPYDSNSVLCISYSTSTNVFVLTQSTGIIHYRVIAFWIDDYNGLDPTVAPTIGSHSNVYFDSRLNYQKIFQQGQLSNPATPFLTHTINHNLGYEPNVRVFCESMPGEVWPATYGGIKNAWLYDLDFVECNLQVYTDRVDMTVSGSIFSPASRLWYQVYYDG